MDDPTEGGADSGREGFREMLRRRVASGWMPPHVAALTSRDHQGAVDPRRAGDATNRGRPPLPDGRGSLSAATPIDASELSEWAAQLAEALEDYAGLRYYQSLARRLREGALLPHLPRAAAMKLLLVKARELRARRVPLGKIINPGAVFASWVKKL